MGSRKHQRCPRLFEGSKLGIHWGNERRTTRVFEKVGSNWGLARIGPGRRRLSREEWKAEQENNLAQANQQKQLADTKKIAKKGLPKVTRRICQRFEEGSRAGQHLRQLVERCSRFSTQANSSSTATT